jgi:hypothetical protein
MVTELRTTQKTDEVWIGGCEPMPAYVIENGPFRPDLAIWLDATHDLIVGSKVLEFGESHDALADALIGAMQQPAVGPPRQPAKVRIADARLAQCVRERFGDAFDIEVAPTPELSALMNDMASSMLANETPDEEEDYLEGGRLTARVMGGFFTAAAKLWQAAAWRYLYDAQLLQLNCASLGVHNKAVSIIGNL